MRNFCCLAIYSNKGTQLQLLISVRSQTPLFSWLMQTNLSLGGSALESNGILKCKSESEPNNNNNENFFHV